MHGCRSVGTKRGSPNVWGMQPSAAMEYDASSTPDLAHEEAETRDAETARRVSILLLVGGICCFPLWAGGFWFRKHPNRDVRMLANVNSGLFLVFCAMLLCACILITLLALFVVGFILFLYFTPPQGFRFNS